MFTCRVCGCHEYNGDAKNFFVTGAPGYSCKNCGVLFSDPIQFSLPEVGIMLDSRVDAKMPIQGSEEAVGYDLYSPVDIIVRSGEISIVDTGVYIELPPNTECQVRSRSGIARNGIIITNAPGTIDPDYRGTMGVMFANLTEKDFSIKAGNRIAQLLITPKLPYVLKRKYELSETTRGTGGFGSTGK